MKQTPLTNRRLSFYSLKLRPFRTACLILVVTILAFTLFGGSVLTASLENGMNSMSQRLGADLMVVPEGYKADMEEVLLKGEPGHFYFSPSIAQQVAQIEGVAQVTASSFSHPFQSPAVPRRSSSSALNRKPILSYSHGLPRHTGT
ncbi:MAG TPA: hypothetical protein PLD49_01705 [Thermoclostridium caenicola]|uniref:hypothetical protein n=1 Tax=Thermoclostridium caenicola TaxID=659425 RepID=UPI002C8D71E3|nr:hypothetical protein [Thermoclostridium caenicola]HOK42369.1 hypothetical protein [Thermoclostridium caenicola]HOL85061.1 hypothetical protein [Thermoclostridium caenicola]HPO77162.1 hypothetical protein [Thermoclostridium caenicola]